MLEVIGDRTVDEVITIGDKISRSLALAADAELRRHTFYGALVVRVDQVTEERQPLPSGEVQLFKRSEQCATGPGTAHQIANGDYNHSGPRARGEADQAISRRAEGYPLNRLNEAEGRRRLVQRCCQDSRLPEITRTRLTPKQWRLSPSLPSEKKLSSNDTCESAAHSGGSCLPLNKHVEEMNARAGCLPFSPSSIVRRFVFSSFARCFFAVYQTEPVIITNSGKPTQGELNH